MRGPSILAAALFGLVASAAQACSFSWAPGFSPEEIKERADLRKVSGEYRLEQLLGERVERDGEVWVIDGRFIGRLETPRGTGWDTWHYPPDHTTTCYVGSYSKPEADAKGTFWISHRKVDGRYEILLWEGDYLPASTDTEQSESDAP